MPTYVTQVAVDAILPITVFHSKHAVPTSCSPNGLFPRDWLKPVKPTPKPILILYITAEF